MSLNVKTIQVGDQEFSLRLTSKAIMSYCKKHGSEGGSPVIAVLEAVNNIEAKIDLLTAALTFPDTKNKLRDGSTLLDQMADDPAWTPKRKNELILDLALESGLLSEEDYVALIDPVEENSKQLITTMARLLTGKPIGAEAEAPTSEATGENPT